MALHDGSAELIAKKYNLVARILLSLDGFHSADYELQTLKLLRYFIIENFQMPDDLKSHIKKAAQHENEEICALARLILIEMKEESDDDECTYQPNN